MNDDDELQASLAGLTGLLGEHHTLERTLVRIAEFAVRAVPSAEGAGLAMLEKDRPQTVVGTADLVSRVDDVQYDLDEGPCVSAVREGAPFTSGNLGGDPRWPRFGPRAGRLGVHSALSLPLVVGGEVLGALNLYATGRDAFDERAQSLAQAFVPAAAASVRNAQVLAEAERLVTHLQTALTSRAGIDQAMGIVMSRTGATADEAIGRLRDLSRSRSKKLADVAREVVDEAVRSARARHAEDRSTVEETSRAG